MQTVKASRWQLTAAGVLVALWTSFLLYMSLLG
jgi:hypothetical protein